jgi:hypothetical protein
MKMEFFLQKIAAHLYKEYGDRLGDQCLVFPNRRAGLYFLKYLSAEAGAPLWAPAIKTINEIFSLSSGLKIAEEETLIFELYKAYRKLNPSAESFDDFYFWGDLLLNDFNDVDKYLADPVKLFSNLADIKRIDEHFGSLTEEQVRAVKQFWTSFNEGARTTEKEGFIKVWSILPALYADFRTSLANQGLAYEGMIYREIAEKCAKGMLPEFKWGSMHFAGFNALNECEKVLMHSLKESGLARFYWDYDYSYVTEDRTHSAGFFIRDNLSKFGNDMPDGWQYRSRLSSGKKETALRIIETSSDMAQVKLIPGLLTGTNSFSSDDAHHTAIVLADESLLVPLLSSVPDSIEDVNITMGYPLKYSPVFSLLSHLLSLQRNSRSEGNESLFDQGDVLNLLRHSFFMSGENSESSVLASKVMTEKRQWIPGKRFSGGEFEKVFIRCTTPAGLNIYLKELLALNYVTGEDDPRAKNSTETEIKMRNEFLYRTMLALNRLESILATTDIQISVAIWSRLIEKIIKAITIPFSGEPLSGIQIMGILETRTLDFSNIILLSANEGVLPKNSGGSSYIPYNLREAYGLPGIRHQDSIFSYYFYRLLHRADNITFIYNSNSEGIKTGEMSRFLLQLSYLGNNVPDMIGLGSEVPTPGTESGLRPRTAGNNRIMEETFLSPGGKAISPSAVNTFLGCRMKFYYRYLCRLKEPEKKLTSIDPAIFGTILHGVMEKLYSIGTGSVSDRTFFDSLLKDNENVSAAVSAAINSEWYNGEEPVKDGNTLIVASVLESYVRMILRFDRSVAPLLIKALEKDIYVPFVISANGKKLTVSAGGYIDRLDLTADIYRIIDYKTGNISMEIPSVESLFEENSEKRNEAWFQVLMYCEIFSRRNPDLNVRPSIYSLRALPSGEFSDHLTVGTAKNGVKILNYNDIRSEFSSGLQSVLETVFSENEPFRMTDNLRKCEFCPYRRLCNR